MPRIEVRCSDEEQAGWKAKAEATGLTLSDMVRAALDSARLPDRSRAEAVADLTRQISRIGNNLNQIATWCNTYKATADAAQVIAHLVAIERELENAYKSISNG
jgi:hypothetical protein